MSISTMFPQKLPSDPNFEARVALINFWNLPLKFQESLDQHFLVYLPGVDIAEMVEQGEIHYQEIWYKVNWLDTPARCYRTGECVLSFRRWRGKDVGYVLIQTKGSLVKAIQSAKSL